MMYYTSLCNGWLAIVSIVPLLNGGLYATGARGPAPQLYCSFLNDNRPIWDFNGEVLAATPSLEQANDQTQQPRDGVTGVSLDEAARGFVEYGTVPRRSETWSIHVSFISFLRSNGLKNSRITRGIPYCSRSLLRRRVRLIQPHNEET